MKKNFKKSAARHPLSSWPRCKLVVWRKGFDQTDPPRSWFHRILPAIWGKLPNPLEPHCSHLKQQSNNPHPSHGCQTFFFFFKSQAWMLLFNVFSVFLWGRERSIFRQGVWMAGKPFGGLNMGPSKIKAGGQGGLYFLSSPTWHTLPLSVFLLARILSTSVARVMKPVADLTARQLGHCPVGLVVMLRS